ncbi:MAG: DNA internalization-related competence protein ComEC/Rec2 [Desulfobacterales bacterium]|nr:DNA internalization-related competence protein ComEC/Rec2 [Desulfobacterales bacterium]
MAYSRPLIPPLFFYILGIFLGNQISGYFFSTLGICLLSIVGMFYAIYRNHSSFLFPLVLFFGLGFLSIQPYHIHELSDQHIRHYTDKGAYTVVGIIEEIIPISNTSMYAILSCNYIENPQNRYPVLGKIKVSVKGNNLLSFSIGDVIHFSSKIRSIRNFNNPGGFDYKKFMAYRGIYGTAYVNAEGVQVIEHDSRSYFYNGLYHVRNRIRNYIDLLDTRLDSQAVLKALILGEQNSIPDTVRNAFSDTGTIHILSVSGSHIGMVSAFYFWIFRYILSYIPILLWNAWILKISSLSTFIPVLVYGLIALFSPPTQRSVFMVTLFLLSLCIEKEHDLVNTVWIAAWIILIFAPAVLFSISFQLSFSAVLGIVLGMQVFQQNKNNNDRTSKWYRVILKRCINLFWVSFFATLGTWPLIMYHFQSISLIGILANVFIVPLVGLIVLPLSLFSILLCFINEYLGMLGLKISSVILSLSIDLIKIVASFDYSSLQTVKPNYIEIICYYLIFFSILYYFIPSVDNHQKPKKRIYQVIFGAFFVLAIDIVYSYYQRFGKNDLNMTMLDVGQGNCAVLELPKGGIILIDGGGFASTFDIGAKVLAPFLCEKKILTIDLVILTHPDIDHIGGLLYILNNFHIKEIWSNHQIADTNCYKEFIQIIAGKHWLHRSFHSLPRSFMMNQVWIEILHPKPHFLNSNDIRFDHNDNSLTVKLSIGNIRVLFPGDIGKKTEQTLVEQYKDRLKSNILIAPHHGSMLSNHLDFIKAVDPEMVIISAGWNNKFHFPHKSVLKRYETMHIPIYRTDIQGAIEIQTDGNRIHIKSTRDSLL